MTLSNRPDIIKAVAVLDDGQEIALVQRLHRNGDPSQCLFFDPITVGIFTIQLRLDYSAKGMDNRGDPTLDADIRQNGEKYEVDKGAWHNTPKTFDGEWIYRFTFQNIVELRFKVRTTSQRHQTGMARIAPPEPDSDQTDSHARAEAEARFRKLMGLAE